MLTQTEAIFPGELFWFAQDEDLACISWKEKVLIFDVCCLFSVQPETTQFAVAVQVRTRDLGIRSVLSPAHGIVQRRPLISSWQMAAANLAFLSSSPSSGLELSCHIVQWNSRIYYPICRVTEVPVPLLAWFCFSRPSINKPYADDDSRDNETTYMYEELPPGVIQVHILESQ